MRKYVILAMVALASLVVASFAQADQTITASVTPSKLDKKKAKNVKLLVDIRTTDKNANQQQPPDADRTVVDFPKNLSFNTKAVPRCKATEAQLQNTTTETAISLCGKKSVVSIGAPVQIDPATRSVTTETGALVIVDFDPVNPGSTPTYVPVQLTAINGTDKNTLYLHSKALTLPVTNILVGKLVKGPSGYGKSLDVTIPQLAAGGIADFKVTVKAGNYVSAVCKSKKMPFAATTTYSDAPTTVGKYEGKCTQKKSKKKKGKK